MKAQNAHCIPHCASAGWNARLPHHFPLDSVHGRATVNLVIPMLFTQIKPMLVSTATSAFDDPTYAFEPKWDGGPHPSP